MIPLFDVTDTLVDEFEIQHAIASGDSPDERWWITDDGCNYLAGERAADTAQLLALGVDEGRRIR